MSTVSVDAATFEILRYRLWSITDEAAITIGRVSGSPVANESYDFNAGMMTATGDVVMIGAYAMPHAAALDVIVRYIIREHSDNPGIRPGDMFLTNDPYVGAQHQPDVALVAPIFDGDRLIAWCGNFVHHSDVGGPVAGSVTAGATSIYSEAMPIPPIRIVEAGVVRKDLEREFLIRSRTPGLNALDLRGQIAANNVMTEGVLDLCRREGTDVVVETIDRLVRTTEARFRSRLAELPDGVWRREVFIEHDGLEDAVYPVVVTLTKRGDAIDLDFSESADQAPSLINAGVGTLRGAILAITLAILGYDLPPVPAGLWPTITVRSRPASIVDAQWPAGVSMGNTAVGAAVRTALTACFSAMLGAGGSERAMGAHNGAFGGQTIFGRWDHGATFGTMILDGTAGGGGAFRDRDGLDSGGSIASPKATIANVETAEYHYPLLYLWRRQLADSGGPGRHRGGVGGEHAYVLHHSAGAMDSTTFAHGVEQPATPGAGGGEPSWPNGFVVVRGGRDVRALDVDDLDGRREFLAPKAVTTIGLDDVMVHQYGGGGGYADPLDRDPSAVVADVQAGLVSAGSAAADYHVVVRQESARWVVDAPATTRRASSNDGGARGHPTWSRRRPVVTTSPSSSGFRCRSVGRQPRPMRARRASSCVACTARAAGVKSRRSSRWSRTPEPQRAGREMLARPAGRAADCWNANAAPGRARGGPGRDPARARRPRGRAARRVPARRRRA